jgi:hypothetical protein
LLHNKRRNPHQNRQAGYHTDGGQGRWRSGAFALQAGLSQGTGKLPRRGISFVGFFAQRLHHYLGDWLADAWIYLLQLGRVILNVHARDYDVAVCIKRQPAAQPTKCHDAQGIHIAGARYLAAAAGLFWRHVMRGANAHAAALGELCAV